ncbi:MAG: hypothetical protein ABIT01_17225, partial [Thermoanaerobaculia bacterium]
MTPRRPLALLAFALFLSSTLQAHELGLVQVEASFQRNGTYTIDLLVDVEHLPPQTSGQASSDSLLRDLERSSRLLFDGRLATPDAHEITPKGGGNGNITRLRLSGRTPSGVSHFTFQNDAIPGFFVLRLASEPEPGQGGPSGRSGNSGETLTQGVEGGKL